MNEYEEISLKELILIILKGWKLIIYTVFIFLSIAIILFFTLNKPTYITQSNGSIIYIQEQNTEFGTYKIPYSKTEDFILILKSNEFYEYISEKTDIDIEELNNSINFSVINTNEFQVTVSNNIEESTKKIHDAVIAYSNQYISYVATYNAMNQINITLNLKLTTLDKLLVEKTNISSYLENELNHTTMLISNNINPIYSSLSNQWIQTKKEIAEIDFSISDINVNIPKINTFNSTILTFKDYLSTNNYSEILKIEIKHYHILSTESYRFSVKTIFPISVILGLMVGVFIIFFKNYWLNSSKK